MATVEKKSARIPPRSEFVEPKSKEGWVGETLGDPTPKEIVSGR